MPAVSKIPRGYTWRTMMLTLVILSSALLSNCTQGDRTPAPDEAARALVAAIQSGNLSAVPITDDTSGNPQIQLEETLEPLLTASGLTKPNVTLGEVTNHPATDEQPAWATANLNWSWPLADRTWDYQTAANLRYETVGATDAEQWALAWAPNVLVEGLQPGETVEVTHTQPRRASILDGKGNALVVSRPVWRIGIDKTQVDESQWDTAAHALAGFLTDSGFAFDGDAYAERVLAAGPLAFVDLITVRQENPGLDLEGVRAIPGAALVETHLDLAPTAGFARPILGTTGEATAEIIENSDGQIQAGDIVGLSGLQLLHQAQLAGTAGLDITAGHDGAADRRVLFQVPVEDGTPLATTFDVALQERAEAVLAPVEPASAIVAIRWATGEIVAAASGPGSGGADTAMLGMYPPGSTFKVVDALAFDRVGITVESIVPCTESITVAGQVFQNVPGYPASALGEVPLRTAFANSCNTAMIAQADRVSQADLAHAATDLGFDVHTPLGTPAFYGDVPTAGSANEHAATFLGQGRVTASPFTMARVTASVAAGHRVDPVLARPVNPAPTGQIPVSELTEAEARAVRDLMQAVVTEGSATMLQDVPGIIGAKTGTAQFGDGTESHTWMIAFTDELAVAVFVEVGEFGATTSGPLMHQFLTGS